MAAPQEKSSGASSTKSQKLDDTTGLDERPPMAQPPGQHPDPYIKLGRKVRHQLTATRDVGTRPASSPQKISPLDGGSEGPLYKDFKIDPASNWDRIASPSRVSGVKRQNDGSTHDAQLSSSNGPNTNKKSPEPAPQTQVVAGFTTRPIPHQRKSTELFRQPDARSITQEALVAEVKGIYAGLVMIESRCIEVDNKQAEILASAKGNNHARLEDEQYKALIALHKTLLNEHHDFFLASQHPSASPALRRLAGRYAMPARMWRHGIHSFLELLRHRLPHSLDHMLAFIYIAYSMIALLYETVPSFKDTWIECLGDLARYRMAVEDDDLRDREVWTNVARFWYTKAADRSPSTGRLYHHLAILARPSLLLQIFFYTKALSVPSPFISARESILTLLQPVLDSHQSYLRASSVDLSFIRIHAMLFMKKDLNLVQKETDGFLEQLDLNIARNAERWKENGTFIMAANCSALLSYGTEENKLKSSLNDDPMEVEEAKSQKSIIISSGTFELARELTFGTLKICLLRLGDSNILPHVHFSLVFLSYVQRYPAAMDILGKHVPWQEYTSLLNELLRFDSTNEKIKNLQSADFPQSPERSLPLTEDFSIRGFNWALDYFPEGWFDRALADDDDARTLERPSMRDERAQRILWLSYGISKTCKFLDFDAERQIFSTKVAARTNELDDTVMSDDPQDDLMPDVPASSEPGSYRDIVATTLLDSGIKRDTEDNDMSDGKGLLSVTQIESNTLTAFSPPFSDTTYQRSDISPQRPKKEDDMIQEVAHGLPEPPSTLIISVDALLTSFGFIRKLLQSQRARVVVPLGVANQLLRIAQDSDEKAQQVKYALDLIEHAILTKQLLDIQSHDHNFNSQWQPRQAKGPLQMEILDGPLDPHQVLDVAKQVVLARKEELDELEELKRAASPSLETKVEVEKNPHFGVILTQSEKLRALAESNNLLAIGVSEAERLYFPKQRLAKSSISVSPS